MTVALRKSVESFSAGTVVEVVSDNIKVLTVQACGTLIHVGPSDLVQLRPRTDDIPARPRSKRRSDKKAVEGLINNMIEGTNG